MSARTEGPRSCAGPNPQCSDAVVLTAGAAFHSYPVTCAKCARGVRLARWVVDATHIGGDPMPGHLCPRDDPWSPRNLTKDTP